MMRKILLELAYHSVRSAPYHKCAWRRGEGSHRDSEEVESNGHRHKTEGVAPRNH
jgi:hypothetical protein